MGCCGRRARRGVVGGNLGKRLWRADVRPDQQVALLVLARDMHGGAGAQVLDVALERDSEQGPGQQRRADELPHRLLPLVGRHSEMVLDRPVGDDKSETG